MIKKQFCAAALLMALLAGSALAQGFAGSEVERTGKLYRKSIFFGSNILVSLDHTTLGLAFQSAVGEKFRVEAGLEMYAVWNLPVDVDWLLEHATVWDEDERDYGSALGYGGYASFQWRHSISKDGFFNLYTGPLVTYHSVSGRSGSYRVPSDGGGTKRTMGEEFDDGVLGVGAVIGIEWDFSNRVQTANLGAIQVRYRTNYRIGLDLRPVFNAVRPYEDYPPAFLGLGLSFGYMF